MLALIPARGGSKGLPGKNIRPLCGKPLIAHSIDAAASARHISRVIVSTDSEEIAEVARNAGAEVPFLRPLELATDTSLAIDTYLHSVERLALDGGAPIDELVVLLPTAPLRTGADIDAAIDIFQERNADSVISYYRAPHPVQWYKYFDDRDVVRSFLPEGDRIANRQKEVETYLPNGAIYVFRIQLLRAGTYFSDRTYPYVMPQERSIDIDTLFDFELAEFLLSRQRRPVAAGTSYDEAPR